jgi:hypothetical protein
MGLVQCEVTDDMYESLRLRAVNGSLELPHDAAIISDLLSVRREEGRVKLPQQSDGRRCDYAPAIALAVDRLGADPVPHVEPVVPDLAFWRAQEVRRAQEEAAAEEQRDYDEQRARNEGGHDWVAEMARKAGWGRK